MVEFNAYAVDCRVRGQIELGEGRLSDQLDHALEVLVRDAQLEGLDDGHLVALPEITIEREELCAVVASGPRGDTSRRLHTWTTHVEIEIGPYLVDGCLHGRPGSTPLGLSLQRAPWVALTDATLKYRFSADDVIEAVETLLINREVIRSYRAIEEGLPPLPWEAARPATPTTDATDSSGAPRAETGPAGDLAAVPPPAPNRG